MVAGMTDPVRPNRLTNPNDFTGPRNVLNELYATADAANAIAAEKTEYDANFPPLIVPDTTEAPPYVLADVPPPVPPPGLPVSEPVDGPISPGRPIVYAGNHVVDADLRRRIKRGYYKRD
jgi:hypothetical protein